MSCYNYYNDAGYDAINQLVTYPNFSLGRCFKGFILNWGSMYELNLTAYFSSYPLT